MKDSNKNPATGQPVSGRKASLSGLGAFKHLSKIKSAVQEHKEKSVSNSADISVKNNVPQTSVEQKPNTVFEDNSNTVNALKKNDSKTIRIQHEADSERVLGVFEDNSNTHVQGLDDDFSSSKNSSLKSSDLNATVRGENQAHAFEDNSNTNEIERVFEEDSSIKSLSTENIVSNSKTLPNQGLHTDEKFNGRRLSPESRLGGVIEYDSNTIRIQDLNVAKQVYTESRNSEQVMQKNYVTLLNKEGEAVSEYTSNTVRIPNDTYSNTDKDHDSNTTDSVSESYSNTLLHVNTDSEKAEIVPQNSPSEFLKDVDRILSAEPIPEVEDPHHSSTAKPGNELTKDVNTSQYDSLPTTGLTNAPVNFRALRSAEGGSDEYVNSESEYNSNRIRKQEPQNSNTNRTHFGYKANTDSNTDSNRIRIKNSPLDIEVKLRELAHTGAQIFRFLFEKCVGNQSYETGKVFRNEMMESTGLSAPTIKTITTRMIAKNLLSVVSFKTGSGGWTIYALNPQAFEIFHKDRTILDRTSFAKLSRDARSNFNYNSNTNSNTDSNTKRSSKIVSNYKDTNYLQPQDGLDEVDLSSVFRFGITKSIVADIRKNNWKISRDQLESLVYRFEKWATQPDSTRGIKNLRGLFCGHLKQISETGHDPLDFIKTEAEQLIEQMIEKRKAALLEIKRKQSELIDLEFNNWEQEMGKSEMVKLVPPSQIMPLGSEMYQRRLKAHFVEFVWPSLSKQVGF